MDLKLLMDKCFEKKLYYYVILKIKEKQGK